MNGQLSRAADVLVFGPLMLYNARTVKHKYLRAALIAAGVLTIAIGAQRLLEPPEPPNLGRVRRGVARRPRMF